MNQLESMRAFVTVVDQGGFSKAARHLNKSTASITRQVQDLEAALGTRLLVRTTRRVHTTDTGEAYYLRSQRILEEIAEADAIASEDSLRPRGRLRVNAPVSFGMRRLQTLVPEYLAAYPEVRLELQLNDRRVDLVEEGYDLVIRIGKLQDSSLIAKRVGTVHLVLCAAPAYLESAPPLSAPTDLQRHNCLCYSYWEHGRRDVWTFTGPGGECPVAVSGNCEINNGDLLTAAAEQGAGIVLQPDFLVGEAVARGRLVPLLPEWSAGTLGVHAVYPHRRHLSARVRTFIDHLERQLG